MNELVVSVKQPMNEVFQTMVHTLSSFGVAISYEIVEGEVEELPISRLNGSIVKCSSYPTKQELLDWLQFPPEFFEDETTGCSLNTDGCCGCGCCYE